MTYDDRTADDLRLEVAEAVGEGVEDLSRYLQRRARLRWGAGGDDPERASADGPQNDDQLNSRP